eukprot:c9068_g1_i1.p1 GENE.c9068_g1_i1~~c9068_g1_i1.p1  ORF type:complete len:806 (-),score=224.98 c9068_g1_i1:359-2776(-)
MEGLFHVADSVVIHPKLGQRVNSGGSATVLATFFDNGSLSEGTTTTPQLLVTTTAEGCVELQDPANSLAPPSKHWRFAPLHVNTVCVHAPAVPVPGSAPQSFAGVFSLNDRSTPKLVFWDADHDAPVHSTPLRGESKIMGLVGLLPNSKPNNQGHLLVVWENGLVISFDHRGAETDRLQLDETRVLLYGAVDSNDRKNSTTAFIVATGALGFDVHCVALHRTPQKNVAPTCVQTFHIAPPPVSTSPDTPVSVSATFVGSNKSSIHLAVYWASGAVSLHTQSLDPADVAGNRTLVLSRDTSYPTERPSSSICFATSDYVVVATTAPKTMSKESTGIIVVYETKFGAKVHSKALPSTAPLTATSPTFTSTVAPATKSKSKSKSSAVKPATTTSNSVSVVSSVKGVSFSVLSQLLAVAIDECVVVCRCVVQRVTLAGMIAIASPMQLSAALPAPPPAIESVPDITGIFDRIPEGKHFLEQDVIEEAFNKKAKTSDWKSVVAILSHAVGDEQKAKASADVKTALNSVLQYIDPKHTAQESAPKKRKLQQAALDQIIPQQNAIPYDILCLSVSCCVKYLDLSSPLVAFVSSGLISHPMCPSLIPTLVARKQVPELTVVAKSLKDIPEPQLVHMLNLALELAAENHDDVRVASLIAALIRIPFNALALSQVTNLLSTTAFKTMLSLCTWVLSYNLYAPLDNNKLAARLRPTLPPPVFRYVETTAAIDWLNTLLGTQWRELPMLCLNDAQVQQDMQRLVTSLDGALPSIQQLRTLDVLCSTLLVMEKTPQQQVERPSTAKYEIEVLNLNWKV